MARFADQAGVGRNNADVELDSPIIRFYDAYLDREVGLVDKSSAFGHGFNFASNESAAIADELGPGASVRDGAQVYLDRWGLRGDGRRQAEFLIRALSEFPQGYDWAKLSLYDWSWANQESSYIGVGEGDFPQGGYRRLYRAMAGPGEVRLGHRVDAIGRRPDGVLVRATAAGRRVKLRGSHVVVTVPLGILKQESIRFEPSLPQSKLAAITRIGFGAVEKVAMVFDEPFWNDLTHTHTVFLSDHAPLELPLFLDLNRISAVPGLIAFCGGGFAHALDELRQEAALGLTLTRLQEILRRDIPRPKASAVTRWRDDPFSRGSYSTTLVGGSADDRDALAGPVGGRVLFAGEATSRARRSTADGAMSSGIREAKRLLRRPAVALSAG
jgi:monoamine oxidase